MEIISVDDTSISDSQLPSEEIKEENRSVETEIKSAPAKTVLPPLSSSARSSSQKREVVSDVSEFFNEKDDSSSGPVAPKKVEVPSVVPVVVKRPQPAASSPSPKKPAPAKKTPSAPAAAPLPLEGLKIAVSGAFEDRAGLEQLVLRQGGQLAGAVSGRTSYLVAGTALEDGRPTQEGSKYRAALDKQVPILSEAQFLRLIETRGGAGPGGGASRSSSTFPSPKALPIQSSHSSSSHSHSNTISSGSGSKEDLGQAQLWVDKYVPRSVGDLVGSAEVCRKLADWLRRWDEVHLRRTAKVPFSKDNPGAKVCSPEPQAPLTRV